MTSFAKIRAALTRNGIDDAATILFRIAVIATAEVSFIALLLIIIGTVQ